MYMKKYPCVYMRGGTSKAVFFHEKDLPEDQSLWDDIFMKVMGTPDVKQIDGMGGTVSSTSKDCHYFQIRPPGCRCKLYIPPGRHYHSKGRWKRQLRKYLICCRSICH